MIGPKGLVGQRLSGARGSITAPVYAYPTGADTFIAPANGYYRFVLRGAGGGGSIAGSALGSGASGAYIEAVRRLSKGERVALSVANFTAINANGLATTATMPNGEVISAGGGQASAGLGGVALAGALDVAISGTAGSAEGVNGANGGGNNPGSGGAGNGNAGGAGAPGNGNFRGGAGAPGASSSTAGHGAGGGTQSSTGINQIGGTGTLVISQVRILR